MVITEKVVIKNTWTVSTLLVNGKSKFEEFYKEMIPENQRKIMANLKRLSECGPHKNEEKFKNERNGICAVKIGQMRIFCFLTVGKLIVLTHGIVKKSDKMRQRDIELAEKMRKDYLDHVRRVV